ncbi:hypothetical protein SAMN05444920_101623 [Nonomuraea solani]|uniref:Uncharacterized protein n=1 Tax=Nonomuraea solani TaxID=1144553 RepID=A0A1H5URP3_9ACTN|nr:hypothetical protein [Nonomuraea solani]SEF77755.1 hypothetical protein SAMN05444920_101623 [Nonomuraea solani]
MQTSPDIRAIEVTPHPVVLDTGPIEIVIDVSATRVSTMYGWLTAPDGIAYPIGFTDRHAPCGWQATHLLRPGAPEGPWRVEVRAGETSAGHDFDVATRGTRAEVRFTDFDAQPPQVPRGELARLTGRAELVKNGATGPGGGLDVVLAFREDNVCGWRELAEAVTDDLGRFTVGGPVVASGDWRAEVRTTSEAIGGRSEAVFVEATSYRPYATQIVGYQVRRLGQEIVHTGRLRGKPVSTWEWLSNQRIWVFYREPGAPSGAFHSAGRSTVTRVDQRGRFEARTLMRSGGAWRVEYFGTARAGGDRSGPRPAP